MIHFAFLLFSFNILYAIGFDFHIDYPQKECYTLQDYEKIQKLLREKIDSEFIFNFYSSQRKTDKIFKKKFKKLRCDFLYRIHTGLNINLFHPEQKTFEPIKLVKIGEGGNNCIVSYASYNSIYPESIKKIAQQLEGYGFNGYFLYQIGGYPTPTGKEIKYVGIPYAFKIFMMLEAQKRGFNNVIWVDSGLILKQDPTSLFNWLSENGVLITGPQIYKNQLSEYILPIARDFLKDKTGVDVLSGLYYCRAGVFGLKLDTDKADEFIQAYYSFLEEITPFISLRPEQWIYMALVKSIFKDESVHHPFKRIIHIRGVDKERENITEFFYRPKLKKRKITF